MTLPQSCGLRLGKGGYLKKRVLFSEKEKRGVAG